jgi:integrase
MGKVTVSVLKVRHPRYKFAVVMSRGGERQRQRYFKTKGEAEAAAEAMRIEVANLGTRAAAFITDLDRALIMEASEKLTPYGKTLREALDFYLAHLGRVQRSCTVADLVDDLLTLKGREKKSQRYQDDLRLKLERFSSSFEGRQVAAVTTDEISTWLHGLNLSAVSVTNYRRVLGVLFSRAVSKGLMERNPVDSSMKPNEVEGEVGILTPGESARLLAFAHDDIRAVIALGMFAGIRHAELMKIDWKEVDLVSGFITVKAAKAKSARRRVIPIRENLAAWLAPVAKLAGSVWPEKHQRGRTLFEEARRAAGFGDEGSETSEEKAAGVKLKPWPHNALRHSFASYHLARWQDAARLALELGHTGTSLIFSNYRELVRPDEGAAYWNISPSMAGEVVQVVRDSTNAKSCEVKRNALTSAA